MDVVALTAALRTVPSREAARALVADLSKPQLVALAHEVGTVAYANANMDRLRGAIVEHTAGCRLDHEAIMRHSSGGNGNGGNGRHRSEP